jgi:hypothetical protein
VIAVLLPAAFHNAVQPTDGVDPLTNQQEGHDILSISHGVCRSLWCIVLVTDVHLPRLPLSYFSVSPLSRAKPHRHNYFHISSLFVLPCIQLFSHKNLYDDAIQTSASVAYPSNLAKRLHISERRIPPASSSPPPTDGVMDPDQRDARSLEEGPEEGEIEEPEMGLQTTIILLYCHHCGLSMAHFLDCPEV